MKNNKRNTAVQVPEQSRILSKPRIFFGILFIVTAVVMALSFASYLKNWKADQSQAGTMLDKTVKSSNIFGKVGDWLGKIFIFDSIGVAAFLVAFLIFVFGLLILKKKIFQTLENHRPFSVFHLLAACFFRSRNPRQRNIKRCLWFPDC